MLLSKSNRKLMKDGIVSFGLPAIKTCPGAGACKKLCYGCKSNYRYSNVIAAQHRRLDATLSGFMDFIGSINFELGTGKKRVKYVRIHDSGDFYSQQYFDLWAEIAQENRDVIFYAYTKSHMLDFTRRPDNLIIIGSMGSTDDKKLLSLYRSGVINSVAAIFKANAVIDPVRYVDTSESDLEAVEAARAGKRIALRKH